MTEYDKQRKYVCDALDTADAAITRLRRDALWMLGDALCRCGDNISDASYIPGALRRIAGEFDNLLKASK